MIIYNINGLKIKDWESFHQVFKDELNFSDYYGRNMDAWIDCMYDTADEEQIVIHINHGKQLKDNCPEIVSALLECSASINYDKIISGDKPNIILSLSI